MTLIKKADVRNYLSARRRNVLPFRSMSQPDATGYSEIEADRTRLKGSGSGAGSGFDGAIVPSITEKP